MSGGSLSITAEQFALAIQDLPVENLYSKADEIRHSINHLDHSNAQLQEYIDSIRSDQSLSESERQEGDKDCAEAIQENGVVIARQKERIELLKHEVERRGGKWHDDDTGGQVNGSSEETATEAEVPASSRAPGGRLTDEDLRRQMMERIGAEEEDEDEGMHL
jgi:hypothetical protein